MTCTNLCLQKRKIQGNIHNIRNIIAMPRLPWFFLTEAFILVEYWFYWLKSLLISWVSSEGNCSINTNNATAPYFHSSYNSILTTVLPSGTVEPKILLASLNKKWKANKWINKYICTQITNCIMSSIITCSLRQVKLRL